MNKEDDSLNSAHTIGVYIGDALRGIVVWIFKNIKAILKIILFGGVMLMIGAVGAMIWGTRAKR